MDNLYNLPDPQQIDGCPNDWIEDMLLVMGYFDDDGNVLKQPRPLLIDRHKTPNWNDIKRKDRVIRRKRDAE